MDSFGTGRVLVHFLSFAMALHGCDVNPVAVEWTRRTLGDFADLRKSSLEPPLPHDDSIFDLVIATSVFTHSPYASQPAWIAELGRIIKPGGLAIVTIHDFDKVPVASRERGWHERGDKRGLHINTFLTREKLEELWGTHFEVVDVRRYPPGQPHVVARRKG